MQDINRWRKSDVDSTFEFPVGRNLKYKISKEDESWQLHYIKEDLENPVDNLLYNSSDLNSCLNTAWNHFQFRG